MSAKTPPGVPSVYVVIQYSSMRAYRMGDRNENTNNEVPINQNLKKKVVSM